VYDLGRVGKVNRKYAPAATILQRARAVPVDARRGQPSFDCSPRSGITTRPGGELELLSKLKGKITHVHVIDSDGSLNEHNTSTHNPFGTGKLNFDQLAPALRKAGVPHDWWCVDLCFWPHAWDVTAQSKKYLDKLRDKHAKA
jgi:hypothetical protein